MENTWIVLIAGVFLFALMGIMLLPIRFCWKLIVNGCCGYACLVILNALSGITQFYFPVNWVSALIAGFGGLPGILLLIAAQFIL